MAISTESRSTAVRVLAGIAAALVLGGAATATALVMTGSSSPSLRPVGLKVGGQFETTASQSATLVVEGNTLLVGEGSTITRTSNRGISLIRGSVIGEKASSTPLTIRSDETTVMPAVGSVWRVDRGFTTRVATYVGTVATRTDTGASLVIPALHQATAAGSALPQTADPLSLTPGDAREALVAPELVSLDGYLARVAEGLDTDAARAANLSTLIQTALGLPAPSPADPASEWVLPAVIARASSDPHEAAYIDARNLRADGGSWGVVAELAGVETIDPLQAAVSHLLDLTSTQPPAAAGKTQSSVSDRSTKAPTSADVIGTDTPSAAPTTPAVTPVPVVTPTAPSTPGPSKTTGTPTILTGQTPDTYQGVVGGLLAVLGALLSPSPTPAS